MRIHDILEFGQSHDCSDLHLTALEPVYGRTKGQLIPIPFEPLSMQLMISILEELLSPNDIEQVRKGNDVDCSFVDGKGNRYRINVYRQQNKPCIAIRLLRQNIPSMSDLLLPPIVEQLAQLPRGLILVTGPTGSGKSTTMAAMIDYINKHRKVHIITIEDPIEYMHKNQSCLVHQREIGQDVGSFASALRSAWREDPDIIMVGEMRDLETIAAAITAAETGHLVISSLHTNSAISTIDRIIDVFPAHQQQQIRIQLSSVLKGVVSQQLMPRLDGKGRIGAFEVLVMTDAISSMVREGKTHQVLSAMQTGRAQGMQLMDWSLANLVREGMIGLDVAKEKASKLDMLQQYLR